MLERVSHLLGRLEAVRKHLGRRDPDDVLHGRVERPCVGKFQRLRADLLRDQPHRGVALDRRFAAHPSDVEDDEPDTAEA